MIEAFALTMSFTFHRQIYQSPFIFPACSGASGGRVRQGHRVSSGRRVFSEPEALSLARRPRPLLPTSHHYNTHGLEWRSGLAEAEVCGSRLAVTGPCGAVEAVDATICAKAGIRVGSGHTAAS